MSWYLSPSGWPQSAADADAEADLLDRGYAPISASQVQAAIDAYKAGTAPPASQDVVTVEDLRDPGSAATAALRAVFGAGGVNASDVGFDVVLLLGESLMAGEQGTDAIDARLDPGSSRVYTYDYTGTYANRVALAAEPLVHQGGITQPNVGPGMSFARWYAAATPTSRNILLVPLAMGGSTLTASSGNTWDPTVAGGLYAHAITQAGAALAAAGPNARLVAALWVQGENDTDLSAVNATGAAYQAALDQFIGALRRDLAAPNLPFVVGGMLPEFIGSDPERQAIAAAHAGTPSRVQFTGYAAGSSGYARPDNVHYNQAGQRLLGRALAAALQSAKTNSGPPAAPVPTPVATDSGPTLGVARGTPAYVAGKFGNALTGGVLAITDSSELKITGPGTLEAWVKTTATDLRVAVGNIDIGWWLGVSGGNAAYGGPGITANASSITANDGAWHHLAVTADGSTAKLWVDGTLAMSSAYTGGGFDLGTGTFGVGGFGGNNGFDWAGAVDDVRVSDIVRYTSAFTASTAHFVADANTVALYHLNG